MLPKEANRYSRCRQAAPAWTVVLISPILAEVLSGATRLSYLFVFAPEIMTWGCGALLIRESVRRWRGGWTGMLLLALALSVAEEFLIQQTSLAPLVALDPARAYGRAFGVNWVWLLSMLGFESVWVVLAPVQIVELIFPERRDESWIGRRGMMHAARLFVVGSFIAWYGWTQRARPMIYHMAPYRPPAAAMIAGIAAILLLVAVAWKLRARQPSARDNGRPLLPPWAAGIAAFVMARPWLFLTNLAFGAMPSLPVWVPLAAGVAWAAGSFFLIRHWSSAVAWSDRHRFALVFGASLAVMTGGFGGKWNLPDLLFRLILSAIAIALLLRLARRVASR